MNGIADLKMYKERMVQHPQHVIIPFYRQQIYQMIDPEHRNFFREWLGIVCAKFVLPIWQDYSDHPLPERMIVAAEKLLRKEANQQEVKKLGDKGWNWLENGRDFGFKNYYSAFAALRALNEARGFDPFEGYRLSEDWEHWLDSDIDLDSSDVTKLAYYAYAGYPDVFEFDPQRCLAFFTWWLDQAIPQAWELAQKNLKNREQ